MRSWTNCFPLTCFERKAKDVNVTPRTCKLMDLGFMDSQSKVPHYSLKLYMQPSLSSQPRSTPASGLKTLFKVIQATIVIVTAGVDTYFLSFFAGLLVTSITTN